MKERADEDEGGEGEEVVRKFGGSDAGRGAGRLDSSYRSFLACWTSIAGWDSPLGWLSLPPRSSRSPRFEADLPVVPSH